MRIVISYHLDCPVLQMGYIPELRVKVQSSPDVAMDLKIESKST